MQDAIEQWEAAANAWARGYDNDLPDADALCAAGFALVERLRLAEAVAHAADYMLDFPENRREEAEKLLEQRLNEWRGPLTASASASDEGGE